MIQLNVLRHSAISSLCQRVYSSSPTALYDRIGPPNPASNLRPIKYAIRDNESELEKKLRRKREKLQAWNEEFWTRHNRSFIKEKEEFINHQLKLKGLNAEELTSDELSVFYKNFLNKNWKTHFHYNLNWHKQNFYVTFLDFQVHLERMFKRFRRKQ